MKQVGCYLFLLFSCMAAFAQKKPLDHRVYDSWQSIDEKAVTANGRYVAFVVKLQEGDGELVVKATDQPYEAHIPRGTEPVFTPDSRFLIARIKPLFSQTRTAKIRKASQQDMPKDSLLVLDLQQDTMQKIPALKSFSVTTKGAPWLAFQCWKDPFAKPDARPDSLARINRIIGIADSLSRVADSLRQKAAEAKVKGMAALQEKKTPGADKPDDTGEEGQWLMVRQLAGGRSYQFNSVNQFLFSKNGEVLVLQTSRNKQNPAQPALILWQNLGKSTTDTVMNGLKETKGMAISEDGKTLAFLAQRDSSLKALRKYYALYTFQPGMDTAIRLVDRYSSGIPSGYILHPDYPTQFSKDGSRFYIGLAKEPAIKDTSLVDFETAKLDLWHYQDDYLQPQQLVELHETLKKSWLTQVNLHTGSLLMLGNDSCETVVTATGQQSRYALGMSTRGYRIQQQWTRHILGDAYCIDLGSGQRKTVARGILTTTAGISPAGKYITWYDPAKKQWMCYTTETGQTRILSKGIPTALYDVEDDHPDDPPAYGLAGWLEADQYVLINDRYDLWQADPTGREKPVMLTQGLGRDSKTRIRLQTLDPETPFTRKGETMLLHLFDEKTKGEGWMSQVQGQPFAWKSGQQPPVYAANFTSPLKAKEADKVVYLMETPAAKDLYIQALATIRDSASANRLSHLNPQQSAYNWFRVELHQWKMLDGRMSEGLLYKPENFDPQKKYPVIFYFYERDAADRYQYIEPMPMRASINIAWYTSNGYLVFDPDIHYHTGQPGEDAYNSVVSAAAYMAKFPWVDSTRLGLQGHSWGGYQVAYLVTRTNRFAAAEAGAPVSNMTSAYGGIRWGSGHSRQYQYEKSQSRIGATLWEQPDRFLKNSPLFRADKIKTPLLILHNDKDNAVPWYQGIELFTAMRRLGKTVWMVNYNDELHGIMERRNRKDWTIRMAQFFDHYLKGAPAPVWMTTGIPATLKGIDWGLDTVPGN